MGALYHEAGGSTRAELVVSDWMDRGLAYAEACFETFRVIHGEVFGWAEHMQRLSTGLACFGLTLDAVAQASLQSAVLEAVSDHDCLVRVTVSGGISEWGLQRRADCLRMHVQVMPYIGSGTADLELREWPFPPKPRPAKFTADYAETLRALAMAGSREPLFTFDGNILATATANILLYRQGEWWTPDAGSGVLPGVVRGFLLQHGLREAPCPIEWLAESETALLSSSGALLRPVMRIGERPLNVAHAAIDELKSYLRGQPGVPQGF